MEEIKLEQLEKMFPDGYVIVYTCPDKQIRLSMNNPWRDSSLFKYHDLIRDYDDET